jgi:hypothetical protein
MPRMQRMYVRWAAAAVAATVAWVGLAPAAPARAAVPPAVHQRTSDITSDPIKSVTVTCPNQSYVFALGGEIVGGDGDVLLTGLYPGPELHSARAVAQARSPHPAPFGVRVTAVCQPFTIRPPHLVQETVQGGVAIDATCPGETVLFGLGYLLDQPVGPLSGRVDALVPDVTLKHVAVHASGAGPGSRLTVFGICYRPTMDPHQPAPHRVEATTDSTDWPKSVVTEPGEGSTFGVGGQVRADGFAHLDGLVPLSSTVGGARASRGAGLMLLVDDEEESLTVYGIRGGTFH